MATAAPSSTTGGAGGKYRKPPARKPPPTPYDRPQSRRRTGGGWLSKIVDPAYRILAGGATRLLPSIFSGSKDEEDDDVSEIPALEECETDERHPEIYTVINDDNKEQEVKTSVRSQEAVGQSDVEVRKASGSVVIESGKGKNLADAGELSKIEQLINGKNFSRDDVTRLMEILQSRIVGLEQERKHSDAYPVGKVDVAGTSSLKPRAVRDAKPEESSRVALRNSDPLWQPSTRETIGSSPVEIAKAYMNSRTADRGFRSEHKDKILSTHKDELSAMPLLPPRSPTTSIGWPGALIEETGYHTPHRSTLRSFSARPYSQAFSSKSKSKLTPLRGESEKLPNYISTPYRQAHTPIFGNLKPDMPEDWHGSAGPIRRTQNKFLSQSPAKVSPFVRSFRQSPLQVKESSDHSGFLSKKASEPGTSNTFTFKPLVDKDCDFNLTPVHQHNSKLARQILEQISKPPSQKQKMEELKLTVSARKTSALSESDEQVSSLRFGGPFDKHEGKRITFFEVPSSGNLNDAASTQTSFLDSTSVPCDDNTAVATINSSANGLEQQNLNEVCLSCQHQLSCRRPCPVLCNRQLIPSLPLCTPLETRNLSHL